MRLRPHLGTLLFPPVAVGFVSLFPSHSHNGDELGLSLAIVILTFGLLAVLSWRFLRQYPTVGVYFSACAALLFPYTQRVAHDDAVQAVLGSFSVAGLAGVIYFAVRGIRARAGDRPQARGFPVIPDARRADEVREP